MYEGRGRFHLIDNGNLPMVTRLGLVAAGSGVTPMLQLLRHMLSDDIDQTRVYMIDVNTSDKDIIARLELDEYAKGFDNQFRCIYMSISLGHAHPRAMPAMTFFSFVLDASNTNHCTRHFFSRCHFILMMLL